MSGIGGIVGKVDRAQLDAIGSAQCHRGASDPIFHIDRDNGIGLVQNGQGVYDTSKTASQLVSSDSGELVIVFDGTINNCHELRAELYEYQFQSESDGEVVLAAYMRWGEECLNRLIGEFAFVVLDKWKKILFGARDRFGVKPLFIHQPAEGGLRFASELKALHATGITRVPDEVAWATYLSIGVCDHTVRTFWSGVERLLPGEFFTWKEGSLTKRKWYDPAIVTSYSDTDDREDLSSLLIESVGSRFRNNVAVGACLSGGIDSLLLMGLIHQVRGEFSSVHTFTFGTAEADHDETEWVKLMLDKTRHQSHYCQLTSEEIPELASKVQIQQDEPFDGMFTLGMVKVCQLAQKESIPLLLCGGGLNEGWAGYENDTDTSSSQNDYLKPEFALLTEQIATEQPFDDPLCNRQYRDIISTAFPHMTRVSDLVSMGHSTELRTPFMDHRIVELGLQVPKRLKVKNEHGKWLPRQICNRLMPIGTDPNRKKSIQSLQRKWLRAELSGWATDRIERGLTGLGKEWADPGAVRKGWKEYCESDVDSGFPAWRWVSLGLMA